MQLIELASELVSKYVNESVGDTPGMAAHFRSFPFSKFSAHVLVPKGTPFDRALEFDRGGLFSMNQTQRWLWERLKNNSKQYVGGTFIVQDIWMTIEDHIPFLSDVPASMFGYDGSPYFWLNCDNLSNDRVEKTLEANSGFQILAAFTSFSLPGNQLSNGQLIDQTTFMALLSGVKEYYMRAYDQESFILLRRSQ